MHIRRELVFLHNHRSDMVGRRRVDLNEAGGSTGNQEHSTEGATDSEHEGEEVRHSGGNHHSVKTEREAESNGDEKGQTGSSLKGPPCEAISEGMVDQDREHEREDEIQSRAPPKPALNIEAQVTSDKEKSQGEADEDTGH